MTWPADDGLLRELGENTPPPPVPVALRLPAPAGVRPGADTAPLPGSAPRFCPLAPAPRLSHSALLRPALLCHKPRPAGQEKSAVPALALRPARRRNPCVSGLSPLRPAPVRPAPRPL